MHRVAMLLEDERVDKKSRGLSEVIPAGPIRARSHVRGLSTLERF
jgi:hypothetical protein